MLCNSFLEYLWILNASVVKENQHISTFSNFHIYTFSHSHINLLYLILFGASFPSRLCRFSSYSV